MNQILRILVCCGLLAGGYYGWRWYQNFTSRQPKVQVATCVNNLKQIALAFRIWAGENNDQYPFLVSTNTGGTMEWCATDSAGFDRNAAAHFRILSNELYTPKVLVCPADKKTVVATSFDQLAATNITYRLCAGDNQHPGSQAVLLVCPVDGNILYCDGYYFTTNTVAVPGTMGVNVQQLSHPRP